MFPKIKFINLVGLLIPFEMLFSYAAHGILAPFISDFYKLFFFGNIIFIFLFVFYAVKIQTSSFSSNLFYLLAFFCFLGLWEVIATILNNSFVSESVIQLFLGFLSPCLIILFVSNKPEEEKSDFFYSLYLGYLILYFIAIVTTLFYYETFPSWFRERELPFQLFMFRSLTDGVEGIINPFQILIGNFNKASNYIIILCLFSLKLIDGTRRPRFIIIFWIMSLIFLVFLFSRLVLMLFPFVYFISGFHVFLRDRIKVRYVTRITSLLAGLVFLGYNYPTYKPALDYLLFSKINEESESSMLGTGDSRFSQWTHIYDKYLSLENIFGIGHQEFSFREYGYLNGGSHNLFIDHYLASGLPSLLILCSLLSYILLKGLLRKDLLVTSSVILFSLLSLREYTFSYLNASIQGGLFFSMLIFNYTLSKRAQN